MQAVDAGDRHRRRPGPRDLRAHLVEHRAQVDDVGLARGVVNGRHALGDDRGHQDVLGGTHRGELQLNLCAPQVIRFGDDAAVLDVAPRAQLTQSGLMHVQGPRSDRVATRQGDLGALAAPDQRTEDTHRRTELPDRREIGVVLGFVGRGDPHDVAVELDGRAEAAQHLRHQRHIEDVGTVRDRARALSQQRSRHQLQNAVLRPPDGNFAR